MEIMAPCFDPSRGNASTQDVVISEIACFTGNELAMRQVTRVHLPVCFRISGCAVKWTMEKSIQQTFCKDMSTYSFRLPTIITTTVSVSTFTNYLL